MTVIRHPNNQGVTLQQWRKTAAGGETSLSGTDDFSAGLAYTVGAEEVFVNGVLIERGVDYTATSGTSVTLTNALVAGDLATVSSPSAFNVANAIPKATITAKGDLLVGTGASTPTNLGVGTDGTTLVANSASATGVAWTAGNPIPNPVLNSAMQIWQRGTSIAIAASTSYISGFTSDRWQTGTGANQAITVSRQLVSDSTNLPFVQYCSRYQRNSGQTGTGTLTLAQSFESANSVAYAGKTVTFSFYARAGANYSAASSALIYQLYTGTGTDQNIFSGAYTGAVAAINNTATLTTTWQRFTATATLATNTNELAIQFLYVPVGTAGANDYFEVTGVQIDIGSVALPFRTYAGTLQGELAACQRYFQSYGGEQAYNKLSSGFSATTTAFVTVVQFPVKMRTAPSFSLVGNWQISNSNVAFAITGSTLSALQQSSQNAFLIFAVASGLVAGGGYYVEANNSTASLAQFSAEL